MNRITALATRPIALPKVDASRFPRWLLIVPVVVYLLAGISMLGILTATAFNARLLADDFGSFALAKSVGVFGGVAYQYKFWNGRYAYNALIGSMVYPGSHVAQAIPVILIYGWLLALSWTIRNIFQLLDATFHRLLPPAVAVIFLSTLLYLIPSIGQDLFWMSGSLTYTLPLILLTLVIGLIAGKAKSRAHIKPGALCFFLAIIAAGCSEMFALMQVFLLIVFLGAAFLLRDYDARRQVLRLGLWAFSGALLGLIIIVAAPGNAVRQAVVGTPRPYLYALARAWQCSDRYYATWMLQYSELLVALCALIGLSLQVRPPALLSTVIGIPALAVLSRLTVVLSLWPGLRALGNAPPPRTVIIPAFIVVSCAACIGLWLGIALRPLIEKQTPGRQGWLRVCVCALFTLNLREVPPAFTTAARGVWQEGRTFATKYDARTARLEAAPTMPLEKLSAWGITDLNTDIRPFVLPRK